MMVFHIVIVCPFVAILPDTVILSQLEAVVKTKVVQK